VLETARLVVRPFAAADFDRLYALRADEEVAKYLGGTGNLREKVTARLSYYLEHHARHGYAMGLVSLKSSAEMIGWGGLQHFNDGEEVEVGYAFARAHWGRGYATELAAGGLRFGFEHLGLERIIAVASPENTASRHVMEKLGMRFERHIVHHGLDAVYYAVTRGDFLTRFGSDGAPRR
jgi:RimJ/RimL family protein N-acetyltransferase